MTKEEQLKILDEICPFYCGKGTAKRTRHNFFTNISTELQSYILGLHTADGCIDHKKQMFRYRVQPEDAELIYLLKDTIGKDARVYLEKPRNITNKGVVVGYSRGDYGIDIYSKKIRDDLTSLNVGYRKTYNEIPIPKIDISLIKHFIRGYFDGDGSVSWGVCKKNNEYRNWLWRKASITSKTSTLLLDIQKYLNSLNINSNVYYRKDRDQWIFEICQKESVIKFFRLLYNDANFYLKRKYEKFSHLVNTEESQLITEFRNAQELKASDTNNTPTSAERPTGMNICADLTGNCENSEIKSSEDNNMRMKRNDSCECCQAIHNE